MSLEKFVDEGWLRSEDTSAKEISDLLAIVERSKADASVPGISDDLRFMTSFTLVRVLANVALRATGYRVSAQSSSRVFETLECTVGLNGTVLRKLTAFSRKHDTAAYDAAGSISAQDLQQFRNGGSPP